MRITYYNYHRNGLDRMAKSLQTGKNSIATTLIAMEKLHNRTIGNNYVRRFFDAKADEIVNIFSDGNASRNQQQMIEVLRKISQNNNSKWRKIN